jgi:hypothetical protein
MGPDPAHPSRLGRKGPAQPSWVRPTGSPTNPIFFFVGWAELDPTIWVGLNQVQPIP